MAEVLLSLDTSSDACSVALGVDGDVLERHEIAPRGHTRLILPMIHSLLAEAGVSLNALDALVMGRGPGAFTGVRIAVGVAQGLAFSSQRPVVPVSSLAIVAQEALARSMGGGTNEARDSHPGVNEALPSVATPTTKQRRTVVAASDARMGEVYWGVYRADESGVACLQGEEAVSLPDRVCVPESEGCIGAGSGFSVYEETLSRRHEFAVVFPELLPRARYALALGRRGLQKGEAVEAENALPVYLRDQVV